MVKIKSSDCGKRQGPKLNSQLRFDHHITDFCRKARKDTRTSFMNLSKRRFLMNSFFKSQFNYCPLVCPLVSLSHENNRKINRLSERCLKTIHSDKQSSLNEFLKMMALSQSMNEISKF